MRYLLLIMVFIFVTIQGCASRNINRRGTSSIEQQYEQASDEFMDYCQTHDCRKNLKIRLKNPDGADFNFEMELAQPIVQDNVISIFPGETFYIAFDLGEYGPENLRTVESTDNSTNTLKMSFAQESDAGMILFINNSSKRYIKYDLEMMLIDSEDIYKTSSCPLMPEISNYESWPHPIFQLVMSNFHWVDESNLECN